MVHCVSYGMQGLRNWLESSQWVVALVVDGASWLDRRMDG